MRRQEYVIELPERTLRRERLVLVDIEAGSGETSCPQRLDERPLIDHPTPSSVDQDGAGLHQRQFPRPDHPLGRRLQGDVKREDVGFGEQRRQVDELEAEPPRPFGTGVRRGREDPHAEPVGDLDDACADVARADDAELGHRVERVGRNVRDNDPCAGCRFEVHMVVTGLPDRNHLQVRRRVEGFGTHPVSADDHDLCITDTVPELGVEDRVRVEYLDLAEEVELVTVGLRQEDRVGDDDLHVCIARRYISGFSSNFFLQARLQNE